MVANAFYRTSLLGLGYLYPAYQCFKAVERLDKLDAEEMKRWCTYWIILSVFTCAEAPFDYFFSWLPMCSLAKVAFMVYLWHPKTMGAMYMYNQFLRPFLKKHEAKIDGQLAEGKSWLASNFEKYYESVSNWINQRLNDVIRQVAQRAQQQQGYPQSGYSDGRGYSQQSQRYEQKVQ